MKTIHKILVGIALFAVLPSISLAGSQTFTSSGTFTVPAGVISLTIKAWGGGAAGGTHGGEGFARGDIPVSVGQQYIIQVGYNGDCIGGCGSGLSGVFLSSVTQANARIIAGGAGMAGDVLGGGGGGTAGGDGVATDSGPGKGGTQTAGGAGSNPSYNFAGTPGTALTGGIGGAGLDGGGNGGNGGAGYFGGGGGGGGDVYGSHLGSGGGGGSGYVSGSNTINTKGTLNSRTNTGDPDYCASCYIGKVAISWATPALPTSSFTISGPNGVPVQNITLNVGDSNTKTWSSTGGTSWSSTASFAQTAGSPTVCTQGTAPFVWANGNTASGSVTNSAAAANAGCTATITYNVTNAVGSAPPATIYLTVVAIPTATISQSTNSTVAGTPFMVTWGSTGATTCSPYITYPAGTPTSNIGTPSASGSFTLYLSTLGTYTIGNECTSPTGVVAKAPLIYHTVSAPATVGTVAVSSNPASSWTITGPATINGSGTSQSTSSQPTGTYSITWIGPGGAAPTSQSLTLTSGGTITFNGPDFTSCESPAYLSGSCATYAGSYGIPASYTAGDAYFTYNSCTVIWTYAGYSCSPPPPSNAAPVANAGPNQTITLPTSSVTMAGSATDSDGTVVSHGWTKVSGPAGSTITNLNAYNTTITGLVQGTYTFRLTATDNLGAVGSATMTVTVNAGTCPNGTNNYSSCTQCPNGMFYNGSQCYPCSNGGCLGTGGTTTNPIPPTLTCNNGATNVPACSTCPTGSAYNGTSCVVCTGTCSGAGDVPSGGNAVCVNGTSNPPACTTPTSTTKTQWWQF